MNDEYIIPDKVYDVIKWIGLVLCPALAVFIGTIGPACGIPMTDTIVTVINAIGVLIGACIGMSHLEMKSRTEAGK